MRLIDAEPLREKLCEHIEKAKSELWVNALCTFVKVLDLTPTIDAVSVVRCKHCKIDGTRNCPYKVAKFGYTDWDFCSCGERKDDEID